MKISGFYTTNLPYNEREKNKIIQILVGGVTIFYFIKSTKRNQQRGSFLLFSQIDKPREKEMRVLRENDQEITHSAISCHVVGA